MSRSKTVDEKAVDDTGPSVLETAVQAAVNRWVDGHLRNSSFSQDTVAWNHFHSGLPALVLGIVKEVTQ